MQKTRATVSVPSGLTLYAAARLASAARSTPSTIQVKCGRHVADARNALALLALCAALGTAVEVEVVGEDAPAAARVAADILGGTRA